MAPESKSSNIVFDRSVLFPLSIVVSVIWVSWNASSMLADIRSYQRVSDDRLHRIEEFISANAWTAQDMAHWALEFHAANPTLTVPEVRIK